MITVTQWENENMPSEWLSPVFGYSLCGEYIKYFVGEDSGKFYSPAFQYCI